MVEFFKRSLSILLYSQRSNFYKNHVVPPSAIFWLKKEKHASGKSKKK